MSGMHAPPRYRSSLGGLVGPISVSAANFLLAIAVQQRLPAGDFGAFAFAQLLTATGVSLSFGLFGSSLLVELAQGSSDSGETSASYGQANAIFCLLAGTIIGVLLAWSGVAAPIAVLFAIAASLTLLRWYLRAFDLAVGDKWNAIRGDCVFAAATVAGLGMLFALRRLDLHGVAVVQIASACASLLWASRRSLRSLGPIRQGTSSLYLSGFKRHGVWACAAILATEVTANAPGYAVALVVGHDAFAPIALATLLFRPLGVVLTGLVQLERPRMARQIVAQSVEELERQVFHVRVLVAIAWIANMSVVAALLALAPRIVFRPGYEFASMLLAVVAMAIIALLKSLREPGTAALQAGAEFKQLARIGVFSAAVSIVATLSFVAAVPGVPVLALAGPILGELVALRRVKAGFSGFKNDLRMAAA